jgi:hypothetical protein
MFEKKNKLQSNPIIEEILNKEPEVIQVQTTEEVIDPAKTAPVYTHIGLGTYRDKKHQRWHLLEIEYNPETGEAKVGKDIEMSDGRLECCDRFKIKVFDVIDSFKNV